MLGGIYEAKALRVDESGTLMLVIPQVHGLDAVPAADVVGEPPGPETMGFAMFLGGEQAWPVWIGTSWNRSR